MARTQAAIIVDSEKNGDERVVTLTEAQALLDAGFSQDQVRALLAVFALRDEPVLP